MVKCEGCHEEMELKDTQIVIENTYGVVAVLKATKEYLCIKCSMMRYIYEHRSVDFT